MAPRWSVCRAGKLVEGHAGQVARRRGRVDLAELVFVAHALKGVAANLLAEPLRELAARTEAAASG